MIQVGCFRIQLSFFCFSTDSRYLVVPGMLSRWFLTCLRVRGCFAVFWSVFFGVAGQHPTNHQLTETFFDFEVIMAMCLACTAWVGCLWGALRHLQTSSSSSSSSSAVAVCSIPWKETFAAAFDWWCSSSRGTVVVDDQVFDPARWGLLYLFLNQKPLNPQLFVQFIIVSGFPLWSLGISQVLKEMVIWFFDAGENGPPKIRKSLGARVKAWFGMLIWNLRATLLKTNSSPLKIGQNPKGKDPLSTINTINFQVRTVSFRGVFSVPKLIPFIDG